MKIIYSQIKKFLPDLDKTARQIADKLTLAGHMMDGYEEKDGEQIISLEIRQNRGDCLGYYGIAKELAVAYDLKLKLPQIKLPESTRKSKPPIKVSAKKYTYRIMALQISNLKNKPSPNWLKNFLKQHEINSINTLVDLTNYIMLWYGIPCHAFDTQKSQKLIWELNKTKNLEFQTLDQTKINLHKNAFIINDQQGPASLIMIGGTRAKVDLNTSETIIEIAVYDRKKVRADAKQLNIRTDAGVRLEKDLDPKLIPQALNHLSQLILDHCGGEITSSIYDYYPNKSAQPKIKINLSDVSKYAGINIPAKYSKKILENLGCKLKKISNKTYQATIPSLRKDLRLKEDLIEEAIRFYGYDKIPTNQPIDNKKLPDITPKVLKLAKILKNYLCNQGYDEIRSWPLIQERYLSQSDDSKQAEPIYTENSINADYPVLRTSIISSLKLQIKRYQKYKVPDIKIFEIGKVYYKKNKEYCENYSLAFYNPNSRQLKKDCQKLLEILKIKKDIKNSDFIEINLDKLAKQVKKIPEIKLKTKNKKAIELTKQIVDLDANVILNQKVKSENLIKNYTRKINTLNKQCLWKLEVTDIYQNPETKKYKYTFRAYYYNISSQKAKKIHLQAFELKS